MNQIDQVISGQILSVLLFRLHLRSQVNKAISLNRKILDIARATETDL